MGTEIAKLLKKKQKHILENWMTAQFSNVSLREDLMSNEDPREQSTLFLDTLIKVLNEKNLSNVESPEFEPVHELLAGVSLSRARQGFTPGETGIYNIQPERCPDYDITAGSER